MFEIGIFCVIGLAMSYWTALWLMGRREDVLHGDFVQGEEGAEPAPAQLPAARLGSADTLQSLLAAIKQDLKDAAQI
jgi:hypothetical protein